MSLVKEKVKCSIKTIKFCTNCFKNLIIVSNIYWDYYMLMIYINFMYNMLKFICEESVEYKIFSL